MPWTDVVLCTDDDLKSWEARMPEMAASYAGQQASNAYDGKRDLVKRRIATRLRHEGFNVESLTNPTELRDCATFLELSLIFRDLAFADDTYAAKKAQLYEDKYEAEWMTMMLDFGDAEDDHRVPMSIPARRM